MSGRTSPVVSPRRLSFRGLQRSWVPYAQTDKVVIERLSKLALIERSTKKHRYRVVQDGVIVALLGNKLEVEEFLEAKSQSLPDGPSLLRQVSCLPADDSPVPSPRSPSHEDSEARGGPEHRSSIDQLRTVRSLPDSLPPAGPSGPGRRSIDHDGLRSKLSSMLREKAGERAEDDRLDPDGRLQQFLQPPSAVPLAHALRTKESLASEYQAARRRQSVAIPPSPDQLPTGGFAQALTWTFNGEGQRWTLDLRRVRLAEAPFAEGAIRQAFRMDLLEGQVERRWVAKRFTPLMEESLIRPDPTEPGLNTVLFRSAMAHYASHIPGAEQEARIIEQLLPAEAEMPKGEFMAWFRRLFLMRRDVEMQRFCQTYAEAFNQRQPGKQVRFLPAMLLGMPRDPYDLYFCEPYMDGPFEKYNNNDGDVGPRSAERNTPQAFSHFSYVHSGKQHLIVDIQGFGDVYTDPQVHSTTRAFGIGNLQQEGIDKFFVTHRCNNVCARLGLSERQFDRAGTF